MPKESLSVYLTAVDGMSSVMTSIADKTKALDKESQELQQTFVALQKANKDLIARKTELQSELKRVNEEVKEARKSFKKLDDEASSDALNKAIEKQQKLHNEIAGTTKALQENQKIYKENIETIRKGSVEGGDGTLSIGQVLDGLGIGQQLSSLAEQAGGALLSSTLGSDMGGLASNALSSAISGAALGTAIAPGIGTAIGAALGGLSGLAGGAIEQWTSRDEAFKDYYGGLYEDVRGRSGEMVGEGSSLASARETNRISFTTLFDGDEDRARGFLEDLIDTANSTPFLYDDLVSMSKTLATFGYDDSDDEDNNILHLLRTVGDTGAALGMGTSDMDAVAQALGRMKSSDKAALEYLNILNDRGIGAVGMLADAKGVSQKSMYEMISKGKISGREAVEIITAALEEAYAGSMQEQSQTFAGLSSTLEGLQQNLNALGGEGYNTLRQSGVRDEVNALNDKYGAAIGEINRVIGENQARKENMQDQYMREILGTVLNGTHGELWSTFSEKQREDLSNMAQEFANWSQKYEKSGRIDKEAGAQMEALYEAAQTTAQAYFDNSDFMQILNDTELDEIQVIRENTAGLSEATQASYRLSQELSKGWGAIRLSSGAGYRSVAPTASQSKDAENTLAAWRADPDSVTEEQVVAAQLVQADTMAAGRRNAFGLNRVPYDEYPALLHEGERVLTASEARAQDAGQAGAPPIQLTITGNYFTGTPEEMADQLAEIIVRKVIQAATAAAPK